MSAAPVCHRITFLYALLYEHAQLNQATHLALHELFQFASIRAFEHIALIANKGHWSRSTGRGVHGSSGSHGDSITFIHAPRTPASCRRARRWTLEALRQANPKVPYSVTSSGLRHIDCILPDAARDVYPYIIDQLESTPAPHRLRPREEMGAPSPRPSRFAGRGRWSLEACAASTTTLFQ